MAKRFTDTEKWKKPFIRGLEGAYKLLWFYILDDCDHAGIWQVDFEVARIRIGEQVDKETAKKLFSDRVIEFAPFKWFLPDFIFFQYGELSEKNRMHKSVIDILTKNKLGAYMPLIRGQGIIQGQGNGQGERKGQIPKDELFKNIFDDEIYMADLTRAHPKKDLKQAFEEMYIHHSQSPNIWQEWEWRQKFNTWLTIKGQQKNNGNRNGNEQSIRRADAKIESGRDFGTFS